MAPGVEHEDMGILARVPFDTDNFSGVLIGKTGHVLEGGHHLSRGFA